MEGIRTGGEKADPWEGFSRPGVIASEASGANPTPSAIFSDLSILVK